MTEVVLPTSGGCMRPWIWPNGKLHIEPCTLDQLRVGEIAVWLSGTHLTAHRVVRVGGGTITTRSDSSLVDDPPVHGHELLGRAVRFSKGRLSYRLDSFIVVELSRVALGPWSKLLIAGRTARALLRGSR